MRRAAYENTLPATQHAASVHHIRCHITKQPDHSGRQLAASGKCEVEEGGDVEGGWGGVCGWFLLGCMKHDVTSNFDAVCSVS